MKTFDKQHYYSLKITLLLGFIMLLGPVSVEFYIPALSQLANYFHSNVPTLQLTVSIFVLGISVAQLIYGPLSDRYGRYPMLIFGMSLYTLASLICFFSTSISVFFIGRFLQAFGGSAGILMTRAIINDTHEKIPAAKKFNTTILILLSGLAFSPIVGSWITHYFSWKIIFVVMFCFGLIATLFSTLWIGETNESIGHPSTAFNRLLKNVITLLKCKKLRNAVIIVMAAFPLFFTFITVSPFVLETIYHVSKPNFGWVLLIVISGFIIGTYLAKWLLNFFKIETVVLLGAYTAISFACLWLLLYLLHWHTLAIVLCMAWGINIGFSLCYANTITIAMQMHHHQMGLVGAITGFCVYLSGSFWGFLVSKIESTSTLPLIIVMLLLSTVLFFNVLYLKKSATD